MSAPSRVIALTSKINSIAYGNNAVNQTIYGSIGMQILNKITIISLDIKTITYVSTFIKSFPNNKIN
jgi:hypothetical protein